MHLAHKKDFSFSLSLKEKESFFASTAEEKVEMRSFFLVRLNAFLSYTYCWMGGERRGE